MKGGVPTTNPKASINNNANITHTGTLIDGQTAIYVVDQNNFTINQNNITIYTDAGVVDYSINMNQISAIITNTGMNDVTVTNVAAFKTDGTNCMLKNDSTTMEVGDMFSVSGCGMDCSDFNTLKTYTDCTGISAEFKRTPSGC